MPYLRKPLQATLLALVVAPTALLFGQNAGPPPDLPIVGIAHVAFQSSSLPVSRMFYTGMLGHELAFEIRSPAKAWYFKINDDQFVKLIQADGPTDGDRLVEIAFQVSDIHRTHTLLRERGLLPHPIEVRPDGTLATTVQDPDDHTLAFVEYTPDSHQTQARGRHLGKRRAADRLAHTRVVSTDPRRTRAFYEEKLGFVEFWRGAPDGSSDDLIHVRMPGERGDSLEYVILEGPPTGERFISARQITLQTTHLHASHQTLCNHGLQDIELYHPRIGRNGHWLFNVFDPDSTRIEYMDARPAGPGPNQDALQDPLYLGARIGGLETAKSRIAAGDETTTKALAHLLGEADTALKNEPYSVTHKTRLPPSGDRHDYYSQAPYLWPDPNQPDGLPYVPRDGVVNPDSRHPDFSDRLRLASFGADVETLALAYHFSGNEAYAVHAARLLKVWFLQPDTRMNPNLNHAQAVPGRNEGRGIGIIDIAAMIDAIDVSTLLAASPAWTEADAAALRDWSAAFLNWMLVSDNGIEELIMRQNHGTMYDTKVVKLALHTGRRDLARHVLETVKTNRIALQIEPDGAQPMELRRTRSYSYSTFNLMGLANLASIGERLGVDLWGFETEDGRSIQRAVDFLAAYSLEGAEPWPYEQITEIDHARSSRAFRLAAVAYGRSDYERIASDTIPDEGQHRLQLLHPAER